MFLTSFCFLLHPRRTKTKSLKMSCLNGKMKERNFGRCILLPQSNVKSFYFIFLAFFHEPQTDQAAILQGGDEELLQPSFWQHLPNWSQPNVFLQTAVLLLRYLHGFHQLSFELWPRLHILPAPHSSATRSASVDGSALHGLHEDPSPGWDVSDTMSLLVALRSWYYRHGERWSHSFSHGVFLLAKLEI